MEVIFIKNNQNSHVCRNYLDGFLEFCDPPDVEPDDISEANSQNYFVIGVVKYEGNIEICPTTNAAGEDFEIRDGTSYSGQNNEFNISGSGIFRETITLLVRKRHEFHWSMSEKYFV